MSRISVISHIGQPDESAKNDATYNSLHHREAREQIFERLKQHREVTLGVDRFANIVAKPPTVDPDKHPEHALTIELLQRQKAELEQRRQDLEKQLPMEMDQTQAVEKVLWKVQDERINLEEENLLLQQKLGDLHSEVDELEHNLGETDVRSKEAHQARVDLEKQLKEAKESAARIQEQLEQRKCDWAQEEKMLKTQAAQARAEADRLQRERSAGEEKLEVLRKELDAATREANQIKASGEKRVAELTAQHGNLKHDIAAEVAEQEVAQKKLQLWRDRFEEDTRRHQSQRRSAAIKTQDARDQVARRQTTIETGLPAIRQTIIGTNLPAIS